MNVCDPRYMRYTEGHDDRFIVVEHIFETIVSRLQAIK